MLLEVLFLFNASFAAESHSKKAQDVIPITMANIRGHQQLYKEGWFLVTSSEKALEYAKENGVDNARDAFLKFKENLKKNNADRKDRVDTFNEQTKKVAESKTLENEQRAENIREGTQQLNSQLHESAGKNATQAWQKFIYGNLSLVQRTQEERSELQNLPGNYFSKLKSDYSNLNELTREVTHAKNSDLKNTWSQGFKKAADEFEREYQESGKQRNSLVALGYVMWGYMKSLFHGVATPAAQTTVVGVYTAEDYLLKSVVLVGGESLSVVGRTVETVGLSIYYTGKTGYKVLSPTLESGLLLGLASAQKISAPLVSAGGTTLGVMNQVVVNAIEPAADATVNVVHAAYESARYGGLVTYDLLAASGSVAVSELKAGMVLGYNALTAIPTHAVLGTANTAFFLAWDGPRLVIAKVSGSLDAGSLPVGTVVDMEKLKKDPRVHVEVIDESPEDVKKVLKEAPRDL